MQYQSLATTNAHQCMFRLSLAICNAVHAVIIIAITLVYHATVIVILVAGAVQATWVGASSGGWHGT
jgi:hypothetical protein